MVDRPRTDRLRELETFVAVAEEGAFNAAARRLNMSPPAVTRLVAALETRLGISLFARTTRRVALTDAGTGLLSDARRILADLVEAEAAVTGAYRAPRGLLRITAPVLFGQRFLAPILCDYLDANPSVAASAVFLDRIVDLIDEGYDVALRIGILPDSELVATRVGAVRRMTVAAPAYVDRNGVPEEPKALREHRLIYPTGASAGDTWDFSAGRRRQTIRLEPALSVNTMTAAIDAAAAGWGITRVLSYQVADLVREGRLVELLADHEDRELPIHLLHSEGRRPAAKIRSFIDFAAQRLRADASLQIF